MGRRPGRPKKPLSQKQVIAAARAAFAEKGWSGASMADIAKRLGIQKSSLFHHHRTKQALYDAVFVEIVGGLARLLPRGDQPWLDELDTLGESVTEYLAGHPEAARLLVREVVGGGPVDQGPGQILIQNTLAATAAFFQRGIDEGHIPEQDTLHLAMSVISMHLLWYAAPQVSGAGYDAAAVEARKASVVRQVRGLVGVTSSA